MEALYEKVKIDSIKDFVPRDPWPFSFWPKADNWEEVVDRWTTYRSERVANLRLTKLGPTLRVFKERFTPEERLTILTACSGMDRTWLDTTLRFFIVHPSFPAVWKIFQDWHLLGREMQNFFATTKQLEAAVKHLPKLYSHDPDLYNMYTSLGALVGYDISTDKSQSPLWKADQVFGSPGNRVLPGPDGTMSRNMFLSYYYQALRRDPKPRSRPADIPGTYKQWIESDRVAAHGLVSKMSLEDKKTGTKARLRKGLLQDVLSTDEIVRQTWKPLPLRGSAIVKAEYAKERIAVQVDWKNFMLESFPANTTNLFLYDLHNSSLAESEVQKLGRHREMLLWSTTYNFPFDFREFDRKISAEEKELNYLFFIANTEGQEAIKAWGYCQEGSLNQALDWITPDGVEHTASNPNGIFSGQRTTSTHGLLNNLAACGAVIQRLKELYYNFEVKDMQQGDDKALSANNPTDLVAIRLAFDACKIEGNDMKFFIRKYATELLRQTFVSGRYVLGVLARAIPPTVQVKPSSMGFVSRLNKVTEIVTAFNNLITRSGGSEWAYKLMTYHLEDIWFKAKGLRGRLTALEIARIPSFLGGLGLLNPPLLNLDITYKVREAEPKPEDYNIGYYYSKTQSSAIAQKYGVEDNFYYIAAQSIKATVNYTTISEQRKLDKNGIYLVNSAHISETAVDSEFPRIPHSVRLFLGAGVDPDSLLVWDTWCKEHTYSEYLLGPVGEDIDYLLALGYTHKQILEMVTTEIGPTRRGRMDSLVATFGMREAFSIARSGYQIDFSNFLGLAKEAQFVKRRTMTAILDVLALRSRYRITGYSFYYTVQHVSTYVEQWLDVSSDVKQIYKYA